MCLVKGTHSVRQHWLLFVFVHANIIPTGELHSYMHNKTHSLARCNPYFGWLVLPIIANQSIGIKCCRFARECVTFEDACMYIVVMLCFLKGGQVISYVCSLLYIVIPTLFLMFT